MYCFLDFQEIGEWPKNIKKPAKDCRVIGQLAQSDHNKCATKDQNKREEEALAHILKISKNTNHHISMFLLRLIHKLGQELNIIS